MFADPLSESRSLSVYVPRDEAFSEVKQMTFSAKTLYSVLHSLVPMIQTSVIDSELGFPHFTAIETPFNEGFDLPAQSATGFLGNILPRLVKAITDVENNILRFETPEIIDSNHFSCVKSQVRSN